jgi:TPR repeat protein
MMRTLIFCSLLGLCGMASADELADANSSFVAKDYPKALVLYSRLADRGNAEAQLRLGEMFWYGEGVPVDRSRGDALFAKAAAAGNKDAALNVRLSAQRDQKAADIAYWTGGYTGADLTAGKFACPPPALPAASESNEEIKSVGAAAVAWRDCHTGFVSNIGDAMPAGKRIPTDVAIVMSEAELQQSRARLEKIYNEALAKRRSEASVTVAQLDKWLMETEKYVTARNIRTADVKLRLDDRERELMRDAGRSVKVRVVQ